MILPCRLGTIYSFGEYALAVDLEYRPAAARKLAALSGVRIHQDGGWGGEMTFVFDVALFDAVAAIVKPKRLPGPRRLSEEQRQENIARLSRYRFGAAGSEQLSEAISGD